MSRHCCAVGALRGMQAADVQNAGIEGVPRGTCRPLSPIFVAKYTPEKVT